MSRHHKYKDRDDSGRIKSEYRGRHRHVMSTPSWWTKLFMNRPKRRLNKRLCQKVERGVHPDEIVWPVGNRKPHEWYW